MKAMQKVQVSLLLVRSVLARYLPIFPTLTPTELTNFPFYHYERSYFLHNNPTLHSTSQMKALQELKRPLNASTSSQTHSIMMPHGGVSYAWP